MPPLCGHNSDFTAATVDDFRFVYQPSVLAIIQRMPVGWGAQSRDGSAFLLLGSLKLQSETLLR